ncbi:phosphoribosyl anthranilate isomerase [Acetobacter estunensis NRIC 0472]|uniref:N-(5'-phosphoribosyl)anthranilate isomerase n=1 Tax=Acetobacter estunensis TaxID=104097 RepID=A0A967B7R5_9PROT|nr:phosphoribosylanthranilate isomerase [Acetobacter estunensis]NHO53726.1 phosphoribosylanthranilate isomerase [Acetobacter estunensis]GBQ20241.1 phosphoribosyl anthranilate isomerase [Acetobacter estunensis NRIC 0472]
MRIGIKICGLTEPAGLDACLEYGADWVGFNFFARSPRYVTTTQAAQLIRRIEAAPVQPGRVGLFVNPTDEQIAETLDNVSLDILQLYTTPERAQVIRQKFGLPVWLSVAVSTQNDLPTTALADRFVIESRPPEGATRPGGNGLAFPWHLTRAWQAPASWMLAGGLRPETVAQAIRESAANAVDVASGVESTPGVKDPDAIAHFIAAARAV